MKTLTSIALLVLTTFGALATTTTGLARAQTNPFRGFLSVIDYEGKPTLVEVCIGGGENMVADFGYGPPVASWTVVALAAIDTRPCAQNLAYGPSLTNNHGMPFVWPGFPALKNGILVVTGLALQLGTISCPNSQIDMCRFYISYCAGEGCWGCNGRQTDSPEISVLLMRPYGA